MAGLLPRKYERIPVPLARVPGRLTAADALRRACPCRVHGVHMRRCARLDVRGAADRLLGRIRQLPRRGYVRRDPRGRRRDVL